MREIVSWYLVVWDRYVGQTSVEEFGDASVAFDRYIDAERELADATRGPDPRLEVVLIGAESREALEVAYPHYFAQGTREQRLDDLLHRLAV